jgi:hypothetical protein
MILLLLFAILLVLWLGRERFTRIVRSSVLLVALAASLWLLVVLVITLALHWDPTVLWLAVLGHS